MMYNGAQDGTDLPVLFVIVFNRAQLFIVASVLHLIKVNGPNHAQLCRAGQDGILNVASALIKEYFEIYFDLDFYDVQSVKIEADHVFVTLQKSVLLLPLSSSSIQIFRINFSHGRAHIEFDLRKNPSNYTGIADCLNELGDIHDVMAFLVRTLKKQNLLGDLGANAGKEGEYVTILDANRHFDLFITRGCAEGRYSIAKDNGEIFGAMHTMLTRLRHHGGAIDRHS